MLSDSPIQRSGTMIWWCQPRDHRFPTECKAGRGCVLQAKSTGKQWHESFPLRRNYYWQGKWRVSAYPVQLSSFIRKQTINLKQWQKEGWSYSCLHDRAISLCHVHYYSSLLCSGTSLCQQPQEVGRNPGSWDQKELNLRLQPGQLEKCKRQQTELHALSQLFQT